MFFRRWRKKHLERMEEVVLGVGIFFEFPDHGLDHRDWAGRTTSVLGSISRVEARWRMLPRDILKRDERVRETGKVAGDGNFQLSMWIASW